MVFSRLMDKSKDLSSVSLFRGENLNLRFNKLLPASKCIHSLVYHIGRRILHVRWVTFYFELRILKTDIHINENCYILNWYDKNFVLTQADFRLISCQYRTSPTLILNWIQLKSSHFRLVFIWFWIDLLFHTAKIQCDLIYV